jgi:hypothetical protein
MRDHERELIAALAEGSLEDETEARALLESSAEARAEYQLQLDALRALSTAGQAMMTESERAGLRRDLWTRLRAEQAETTFPAGIYRWSLVAAALFVVVGLAAVLGGGVLNQAQSGEDMAREAVEATAADESDTTVAAAEAFDAPAEDGAALMPPGAREYFAEEAAKLREGETVDREGDDDTEEQSCLATAGLFDHEVIAVVGEDGTSPVPGSYLAAVPTDEPIGADTPIHFVDSDTCEEVYTDV